MDLKHLRTFVTVAEQGTISKASLRLHVAQPALSRQISALEHELGLRLFDRVGRRLVLTGEGEQMLGECRGLLSHIDLVNERAIQLQCGDAGLLKVVASPQMIESVFSTFPPRYAERHPKVQVKLIEAVGLDQLAMLERGEVHFGIGLQAVRADDRRFATYPLPPIEFLAACRPSLQLSQGDTVDIRRLTQHPLLLLDSSFVVRKTFDAACRRAGVEPSISIASRAPHTLLALAEAGQGVAIVPSVVRMHRYGLHLFRITHERKPLREPLVAIWNKRLTLPRYAEGFCEALAEHMRSTFPISRPSIPGAKRAANS
jgi:DNA-binding transcriptional LysR family regulator